MLWEFNRTGAAKVHACTGGGSRRLIDGYVQPDWRDFLSHSDTKSDSQEAQDSGASQPATAVSLTGEAAWELPLSAPPLVLHNRDSLIAYKRITKYLGGCGGRGAQHYFSLFGEIHSDTAPFGSRVWDGMRELANFDDKLRQYPPEDIRLGWFQAPQPFSKKNAELPLEQDQSRQLQYPAFFVKPPAGDLWIVRCLAIL